MYMNVGKAVIEKNKGKLAKSNFVTYKCCWKRCRNDSSCNYLGNLLCEKHMEKIERDIERLYEAEYIGKE